MASLAEILAKFGVRARSRKRDSEKFTDNESEDESELTPFERTERDYAPLANALGATLKSAATLPKRLIEASEERRLGGDYDPQPATELMGSLYGLNAPFAPLNAAGAFGGRLSRSPAAVGLGALLATSAKAPSAKASEDDRLAQVRELQEAQLRRVGESALKRGLPDTEDTYKMLGDLLAGRTQSYSPEQLNQAQEIFRDLSESDESKRLRAAREALRPKVDPLQELLRKNDEPDWRYRAPGYFPRRDILAS